MKENKESKPRSRNYRPMRAKLIFNPGAGEARLSTIEIQDVIHEMQFWKLVPEAYLVEPGSDLERVVQDALADGIRMFVVCGGDGTISSVARILAGTKATLGIIPIGTQNNTALSLGIPNEVPDAIAILRKGKRIKVDIGQATIEKTDTLFLEVCSVGLVSSLFPSADDIQHGHVTRIGDFLSTLVNPHLPRYTLYWMIKKRSIIRVTLSWFPTCLTSVFIIRSVRQLLIMTVCWMCCSLPT